MKILVTGAKGMLGQDLCPILEDEGFEVIETDVNNMDFTKEDDVSFKIEEIMPDYIVHLGAYTNVDEAEEATEKALKIN